MPSSRVFFCVILMITISIGSTEAHALSGYNDDPSNGCTTKEATANADRLKEDSTQGISKNNTWLNGLNVHGIILSQLQYPKDSTSTRMPVPSKIIELQVEGSRFRARKEDGTWATDEELVGALLVVGGSDGSKVTYRIDSIEKASYGKAGEMFLYTFSIKDPATDNWINFCRPDSQGMQRGFPLSGYWDEKGYHIRSADQYSITCTSGVIAKCIKQGYVPWKTTRDGKSLWEYHQACTRMLRADYCGNGKFHTREGTKIELWDREGIQLESLEPGLTFEAAWSPDGAV